MEEILTDYKIKNAPCSMWIEKVLIFFFKTLLGNMEFKTERRLRGLLFFWVCCANEYFTGTLAVLLE
jgi:hypothetical protein